MKKIEAIIKPFKLEPVKDALEEIGVHGFTIVDARGIGRPRESKNLYSDGPEYLIDYVPAVKIEIVASDEKVEEIIETISNTAKTGQIGDGKIFISPITEVIRIRSGERNEDAL